MATLQDIQDICVEQTLVLNWHSTGLLTLLVHALHTQVRVEFLKTSLEISKQCQWNHIFTRFTLSHVTTLFGQMTNTESLCMFRSITLPLTYHQKWLMCDHRPLHTSPPSCKCHVHKQWMRNSPQSAIFLCLSTSIVLINSALIHWIKVHSFLFMLTVACTLI